jgi:hypothetical protein
MSTALTSPPCDFMACTGTTFQCYMQSAYAKLVLYLSRFYWFNACHICQNFQFSWNQTHSFCICTEFQTIYCILELSLQSQYILSILMFVAQNMHQYNSNTNIHTNNTKCSTDLNLPFPRLSTYQRGTFYIGVKIVNNFPFEIKAFANNIKQFKATSKNCIYFIHSIH